MNTITLIGRISNQPEEMKTKNKSTVLCKFSVAIPRKFDRETADFFNCVAFGKTAEIVLEYFDKGEPIALQGRVEFNRWTSEDGKRHYDPEVIIDSVEFVPTTKKTKPEKPVDETDADEGIDDEDYEPIPRRKRK